MSKLGDEPAYPCPSIDKRGCTKRELFAAIEMNGMLRGKYEDAYCDLAVFAVQAADDLLAELAKEPGP